MHKVAKQRSYEVMPSPDVIARIQRAFYCVDGEVRWLSIRPKSLNGRIATKPTRFGYLKARLTIDGRRREFMAHRLVWFFCTGNWPLTQLDHINGVRDDNRMSNLRECTHAENTRNRKSVRQGFKGITAKPNGRWQAQIDNRYLGCFTRPEDAARAYDDAARKAFGEFARLNFPEAVAGRSA